MSSEELSQNLPADENAEKKPSKKDLAKAERMRKRQEAAAASSAAAAIASVSMEEDDKLAANYGEIPLKDLQSKEISGKKWTEVKNLTHELKDNTVLIRGHAQAIRAVGKKMAFVVVRERGFTVQCVLNVVKDVVSPQMVKFATSLSRESMVDIEGVISVPSQPITGATQQVEIQVRKLHCVNKAIPTLPINIEDAARSEIDIERALQAGEQLVRVNQDTRLNNRVLDMRTHAVQSTFRIQSQVENVLVKVVQQSLDWIIKGTPACLAQSPQLHKQMAICGDFGRVFEVGPVFRAEDSFTHRHLCEFVGLDVEMEIKEHYSEVMDIVDRLFVQMFDTLNEKYADDLEAINRQYPFEKLKEAGTEIDPFGDLNNKSERKLG